MNRWGKAALAATAVWWTSAALAMSEAPAPDADLAAFAGVAASGDALYAEHWIRAEGDNNGGPFAIVDKRAARIYVFGAAGRLVGASPTLLGLARGDVAVPGSGQKDPAQLLPDERKTPAGRFASSPGVNLDGESVVWVDYDSGIAIHRVRPGRSLPQRLHSLATDSADDKRMSLGCVVVPEEFFSAVVMPTLGQARATVYVLPEETPVQAMFRESVRPLPPPVPAPAPESVAQKVPAETAVPAEPAAPVAAAPGGSGTDGESGAATSPTFVVGAMTAR